MRMGLVAPGVLRWGDVPHLASLIAPRRLLIAGGASPQDDKIKGDALSEAFATTTDIYKMYKASEKFTVREELDAEKLVKEI
jgi:hypothetical protein